MNRSERARHLYAEALLRDIGRRLIVPWPVYTEADLFLRSKGLGAAANTLGRALLRGEHVLDWPDRTELSAALVLLERYGDLGIDLPDAVVMAMADARDAKVVTWDFRHFRAVVFRRGETIPLVVNESELPGSQR